MAYTASISLKNGFTDGSTRTFSLSPFAVNADAIQDAKANIMQLNATGIDSLRGKYISDEGADFNGVKEATITTTQKTLVYAKTAYLGVLALSKGDNNDE